MECPHVGVLVKSGGHGDGYVDKSCIVFQQAHSCMLGIHDALVMKTEQLVQLIKPDLICSD